MAAKFQEKSSSQEPQSRLLTRWRVLGRKQFSFVNYELREDSVEWANKLSQLNRVHVVFFRSTAIDQYLQRPFFCHSLYVRRVGPAVSLSLHGGGPIRKEGVIKGQFDNCIRFRISGRRSKQANLRYCCQSSQEMRRSVYAVLGSLPY